MQLVKLKGRVGLFQCKKIILVQKEGPLLDLQGAYAFFLSVARLRVAQPRGEIISHVWFRLATTITVRGLGVG